VCLGARGGGLNVDAVLVGCGIAILGEERGPVEEG
jgi:hypothetical protein